ncbi:hypothetical protein IAU60_003759 [Kwoniella sp. DSM 27419]
MLSTHALVSVLAGAALTAPAFASTVFTKDSAMLTFYYDVGEKAACGKHPGVDPVPAGWAKGINSAATYCEQQRGYSLDKIGTNAIVAFDQDKVWADPAYWCGREVQVFAPDGSPVTSPDGPLYIWDSCQNCAGGGNILDVSAEVFVEAKGGTCDGDNPKGYSYKVLDNFVVDPSVGLKNTPAGSSSTSKPVTPAATSAPALLASTGAILAETAAESTDSATVETPTTFTAEASASVTRSTTAPVESPVTSLTASVSSESVGTTAAPASSSPSRTSSSSLTSPAILAEDSATSPAGGASATMQPTDNASSPVATPTRSSGGWGGWASGHGPDRWGGHSDSRYKATGNTEDGPERSIDAVAAAAVDGQATASLSPSSVAEHCKRRKRRLSVRY